MKSLLHTSLFILLPLFGSSLFTACHAQEQAVEVAVTAEAVAIEVEAVVEEKTELVFEAQNLNGEVVNLGDQIGQGKWSLVMFWQLECSVCRQQEPVISEFHDKYADKNVEVIAISIDGMERVDEVKAFMAEKGFSYPTYVGDLGMMAFNYQAITEVPFRGTPTFLLFNPEGELKGDNPGPVRLEALEKFIASRS